MHIYLKQIATLPGELRHRLGDQPTVLGVLHWLLR